MINNNNNDNTEDNSKSPVVAALRRHFGSVVSSKEIADTTLNERIDNTELAVQKVITVRPLGLRNAR